MKRVAVGTAAAMLLGLTGAARAAEVSIDFTGTRSANRVVSSGLTQVNNAAGKDGATTIVKKGGVNVAATGGTDAARYLYLKIAPAFKKDLKSVWVTVEYFDEGRGGFRLNADTTADDAAVVGRPTIRFKYDTQQFTSQTWHVQDFELKGGMEGGADIRIDDRATDAEADGQEFIARVRVSDIDPNTFFMPFAVTKPTINGAIGTGEWDDALTFTLDHPRYSGHTTARTFTAEQFSGVYSFKYDETALYILGQVRDATPRMNDTSDGTGYWRGDGIEVFIGLDESNPERTTMVPGDFHAFVGLGETPGWAVAPGTATGQGAAVSLDPIGNNIGITNTSNGYIFEVQIPWTRLDASAKVTPGQRIALYMFANDGKSLPSNQDEALGPTGITGPSGNAHPWIRGFLDLKP